LVVDGHDGKEAEAGAFFGIEEEQEPEELNFLDLLMVIIYS